jgi:hypothetical protein
MAERPFSRTTVRRRRAAPLGRNKILAHVEIAREHGLGDVLLLADGPDLGWGKRHHGDEARLIELAHRALVDRADLVQRLHGFMDGRECVALILRRHRIRSP